MAGKTHTMLSDKSKSKTQWEVECIINRLPGDLIEQIFCRLPVSTLLRCISVCKQWYNFIRDPHFAAAHLQQASSCTLLFFPQESDQGDLYPSDAIIFDEAWSQSKWAVPVIGPDDFLCGSCNGLLRLYTKTSTIKIANLATGECLHLNKPAKNLRGDHFSFYSFGFHPVMKQYMVAHFLADRRKHSRGTFNVIQVYTLGSENWKGVRTPESLSLSCIKDSGVVNIDGAMYWLTEDTDANWNHAVISFDLSAETFAKIKLPAAELRSPDNRRFWVTELYGKVCIATAEVYLHIPGMLSGDLQIWTLDNKEEQRWTQRGSIQHPPSLYIPGPHFVQRDKIMMQGPDCNLYSYELFGKNCKTGLSNMVHLLDFGPHKPEKMQSFLCVKSLVRLDAYKNIGVVRGPKRCEGWDSKKWEVWEQTIRRVEDQWSTIYQQERDAAAIPYTLAATAQELLQHLSQVIRQNITMQIDQILQHVPYCPVQVILY
ncbi:unnamed protein product [Urochloa decumbens]|uniref:F-box domain-containing protein n=1 Tax=Urochloa decumbens TaxID=240449 RepID=A0ABC9GVR4_9POAL